MTDIPPWQTVARLMGSTGNDTIDLEGIYAAEVAAQARICRTVPYTADLAQALVRRCQRAVAMRAIPLGVQATDLGYTRITSTDPELRRLEAPYRRVVVR